jgi:hypothetical protein
VLYGANNLLKHLNSLGHLFMLVFNYLYKSKLFLLQPLLLSCISINHIIISEEMCESIQMAGIFPPPSSPKSFTLGAIPSVIEV